MENPPHPSSSNPNPLRDLVRHFVRYTASSSEEALFFLHGSNYDLDEAIHAYSITLREPHTNPRTIQDQESNADPLYRQRSQPYPPFPARPAAHAPRQLGLPQGSENMVKNEDSGRGPRGIGRVTDLNKNVGGDKSCLDFGKCVRLNGISKGRGRSPWEEPPETESGIFTFLRNTFTDDDPLRKIRDLANKFFWEEQKRHPPVIPETGRTSGINDAAVISTAPGSSDASTPYMGLVVDDSLPTTYIQIRLADRTQVGSRFNYSHTIRDIRAFIDDSGSRGARDYQLQAMGFPLKHLMDVNQTIEQAGIANSVLLKKI